MKGNKNRLALKYYLKKAKQWTRNWKRNHKNLKERKKSLKRQSMGCLKIWITPISQVLIKNDKGDSDIYVLGQKHKRNNIRSNL